MYAIIKHTSDNAKDVNFHVIYNDVMYELMSIEINGTYYDTDAQPDSRALYLYHYMVSRVNVWAEIKKFEQEIAEDVNEDDLIDYL